MSGEVQVTVDLVRGHPALVVGHDDAVELAPLDALLLWMIAARRRWVRDELTGLLWPEANPRAALNSLKQRLWRLRQRIRDACALASNKEVVVADAGLALAARFDPLHALSDPQADTWLPLAQPGSSKLAGAANTWIDEQRSLWVAGRVAALSRERDALRDAREVMGALAMARRIVAIDPSDESAIRALALLHKMDGDTAAAWQAYEAQTRVRQEHLNLGEDNELAALLGQRMTLIDSPRAGAQALAHPPVLVGREDELTWLLAQAQSVGRVLLIGPGGIGKTRLATEACDRLGVVLRVRARAGDQLRPYGLLQRLVLRCVELDPYCVTALRPRSRSVLACIEPSVGVPAPSIAEPEAAASLGELLRPWKSAWIDDLHHADEASLRALGEVTSVLTETSWIFCSRPWLGELPEGETVDSGESAAPQSHARPSMNWLKESGGVPRLVLRQLSNTAAEELIRAVAPEHMQSQTWVNLIKTSSQCSPLFLLELIRHLRSHVSVQSLRSSDLRLGAITSIRTPILGALESLSATALALVRVAALSSTQFSPELASRMLGNSEVSLIDPWRELEMAQLLVDGSLVHDVVRDVLVSEIPKPLLRSLNFKLGKELQAQGAPAAVVASHCEQAAAWRPAARAYVDAALLARRQGRVSDEATLFEQAARCYQTANEPAKAFDALLHRLEPLINSNATEHPEAARQLLELAHTPQRRIAALALMGHSLMQRGLFGEARPVLTECLALTRVHGDAKHESIALRRGAICDAHVGEVDAALEALAVSADRLELLLEPADNALYQEEWAEVLLHAGRRDQAVARYRRAEELLEAAELPHERVVLQTNISLLLHTGGRANEAYRILESLSKNDQAQFRTGSGGYQFDIRHAMTCCDLGFFDRAITLLEPAVDGLLGLGESAWACVGAGWLANVWAALGEHRRGLQVLERLGDSGVAHVQANLWLTRARLLPIDDPRRVEACQQGLSIASPATGSTAFFRLAAEYSRHTAPDLSIPTLNAAVQGCIQQGLRGLLLELLARRMECLVECGKLTEAESDLADFGLSFDEHVPLGGALPDAMLGAARTAFSLGDAAMLGRIEARFGDWLANAMANTSALWHHGLVTKAASVPALLKSFPAVRRGLSKNETTGSG